MRVKETVGKIVAKETSIMQKKNAELSQKYAKRFERTENFVLLVFGAMRGSNKYIHLQYWTEHHTSLTLYRGNQAGRPVLPRVRQNRVCTPNSAIVRGSKQSWLVKIVVQPAHPPGAPHRQQ